jgi:CRISPR/Cas system CMR subunit Cmr6 (Cas7 group RAMP superfamily)
LGEPAEGKGYTAIAANLHGNLIGSATDPTSLNFHQWGGIPYRPFKYLKGVTAAALLN